MTNATTGSDRIVPGQPPAGERGPLRARLAGPAVTHWQFTVVVLVAAVMRFIVVLGVVITFTLFAPGRILAKFVSSLSEVGDGGE